MAPPGVGKTAIAETLSRVIAEDDIWIPYAVEVDGQIVTVYDPVIHKPGDAAANPALATSAGCAAAVPPSS
jgi:hypothetical protein